MKSKLFISTVVLIMAAFSVGGSTVAWFTSQADPLTSTFSAGTLDIEVTGGDITTTVDGDITTSEVSWSIENTGSKATYIRARIEDLQWGDIDYQEDGTPERILSAQQMENPLQEDIFLVFEKGSGATVVGDLRVAEGNQLRDPTGPVIGQIIAWEEQDGDEYQLFVKVVFFNKIAILDDESFLYVGTEQTQSVPSRQQWSGHYTREYEPGELLSEDTYEPIQYAIRFNQSPEFDIDTLADGELLYIAYRTEALSLHRSISGPLLGEDCEGNWIQGDGGWWYYGTEEGPTLVPAQSGDNSKADICFTVAVEGIEGSVSFSLYAEAVQATHSAIDHVWVDPDHPWYVPPPNPSLRLALRTDESAYIWGDTVEYTIDVINNGNVTLEDITVTSEDLDIPSGDATIASLAPGQTVRIRVYVELEESYQDDPLDITKTVGAASASPSLSASASATITVNQFPNMFAQVKIGEYVSIDGVIFQKIGENRVLRRTVGSSRDQATAITDGISYWSGFSDWATSSSLLTQGAVQDLIDGGYQSSIVAVGSTWWVSDVSGNQGVYVNSDGSFKTGGGNRGFRPALNLKPDLELDGGSGTAADPYIIVNPNN